MQVLRAGLALKSKLSTTTKTTIDPLSSTKAIIVSGYVYAAATAVAAVSSGIV